MIQYFVGASLLWWLTQGQKKEEEAAPVTDPYAAVAPVDANMPPDLALAVRNCWQAGTQEELTQFAQALGLSYPIARGTLLSRAYEVSVAQARLAQTQVQPAPAPAPAPAAPVEARAVVVEGGKPKVVATRPLTKEEIHKEEQKAIAKATEANGKGLTAIAIPVTAVVETVETDDGPTPPPS